MEWQGWNSWRSVNNDFNREFIFSVAQNKHDATLWLFGGIWEVLERRPQQQAHSYTVAPREDLMGPFIRRLWVRHKRSGRNIRQRMESVLPAMTVSSILEEPFAGDPFPGHDRINHSLADLQAVVSQARADWRIALESMKGVYVIHDKETGDEYYRTNMRFALLEYWSMRTDDQHVLQRESYWKDVLHARSLGHNKN